MLLNPSELVKYKGTCNHLPVNGLFTKTILGSLIVTSQRLYFEPKYENQKDYTVELYWHQIQGFKKCNTSLIIPNGTLVISKTNKEYKFVVFQRKKLIAVLTRKMSNSS